MIELSRTQDEEVGDGTTSVIVLGIPFLGFFFFFLFFVLFPTVVAMGVQKQDRPLFFYTEFLIFKILNLKLKWLETVYMLILDLADC